MSETEIKLQDLWKALTKDEKARAMFLFLSKNREANKGFADIVAKENKFRPAFVQTWSVDKIVDFLCKRPRSETFYTHYSLHGFIIAWLVEEQASMLERFLDEMGIPHEVGIITKTFNKKISSEKLTKGYKELAKACDPRHIAVYMLFLVLRSRQTRLDNELDIWVNLEKSLKKSGMDALVANLEQSKEGGDNEPEEENAASILAEGEVDECETFTTMDIMMFRLVVDAVTGREGAMNRTQIGDVIDELVALNSDRRRSIFHKGFLHSVDSQECDLEFPGANEERRCWYLTGYLVGLARTEAEEKISLLISENKELFRKITSNVEIDCGRILLRSIRVILFKEGFHIQLRSLTEVQISRLNPKSIVSHTHFLYDQGTMLLRNNNYQEARGYFETVDSILERVGNLFDNSFKAYNRRKRGQSLQHKGQFSEAKKILVNLIEGDELGDKPNAQADIGLIEGSFRSLRNVLPTRNKSNAVKIKSSLEKGREHFESSIKNYTDRATNAHFCMGILELFSKSCDNQKTCDHLSSSYEGMMEGDKYSETDFLPWNKFLLSLALTESLDPGELEHAESLYKESKESKIDFPSFLLGRLLQASSAFDQSEFSELVAEDLLEENRDEAVKLIRSSGLYVKSKKVREIYLEQLRTVKWSSDDKWKEFKGVLAAALSSGEIELAEVVLDQIETLASGDDKVAEKLESFLGKEFNYDPAWTQEEAVLARIQILERTGKLEEAGNLLQQLFYKVRMEEGEEGRLNALAIVDRIDSFKIWPMEELDSLRTKLPEKDETALFAEKSNEIRSKAVNILYVGGDQKQSKMDDSVKRSISTKYPNFRVTFIHPGWSSNWNQLLPQLKKDLPKYDALVLSRLVRTMFGRNVRAMCNSSTPWFSCTGKGRKSIARSIEGAALYAAANN